MKNSFAYRLWKHSRLAFVGVLVFVLTYAVLFSKKMDMAFFPYNAMFAFQPAQPGKILTYGMKFNDTLVSITRYPYWKKDFLEASLHNYAAYVATRSVYLDQYFRERHFPPALANRLVPPKRVAVDWPAWFVSFAGCADAKTGKAEIFRYALIIKNGDLVRSDSTLVYTVKW